MKTSEERRKLNELRKARAGALDQARFVHKDDASLKKSQDEVSAAKVEVEKARKVFHAKKEALAAKEKAERDCLDQFLPEGLRKEAMVEAGCVECGK